MSCNTANAARSVRYKKVQKMQFEKQIFEPDVQPMEFISMDIIGEFHPPASSKGNRYALTAVCMLTSYMFCIPIKNKTAEVCDSLEKSHHLSIWCLQNNGTEFRNVLFSRVTEQLEVERKFIHLHTDPNQMAGLRDSTNSSKTA